MGIELLFASVAQIDIRLEDLYLLFPDRGPFHLPDELLGLTAVHGAGNHLQISAFCHDVSHCTLNNPPFKYEMFFQLLHTLTDEHSVGYGKVQVNISRETGSDIA